MEHFCAKQAMNSFREAIFGVGNPKDKPEPEPKPEPSKEKADSYIPKEDNQNTWISVQSLDDGGLCGYVPLRFLSPRFDG